MQTALLLTRELKDTMPESIKTVMNFGEIMVVFDTVDEKSYGKQFIIGEHVILKGDAEDFKNWLRPFDAVYVGVGSPMQQEFHAMHIK